VGDFLITLNSVNSFATVFNIFVLASASNFEHRASYPVDTKGQAQSGHNADHSPPPSAEVKNE
jgi:hypothetical protein